MTDAAAREQSIGGTDAPDAKRSGRFNFRAAAASFWLAVLFRLTALAPGFVRAMKPLCVRAAVRFSRQIRDSTSANAARIFGPGISRADQRVFAGRVVASFYDFVRDFGRCSRATRDQLVARIESVHGLETYQAIRGTKQGAMVVTAHMGSFEVGLAALSQHERRIHVVYKRDRFGTFETLRTQLRRQLNVSEAPVDDGWTVWMRLREALQNDEVVAIQGDRVMPGHKGLLVPFLNGHVMLPTGPAKLALASGAPIVPIFSIRTADDKVRIFIEEPIVVASDASAGDPISSALHDFAAVLAKFVVAYPDQWLVLEKAFREDQAPISAPEGSA